MAAHGWRKHIGRAMRATGLVVCTGLLVLLGFLWGRGYWKVHGVTARWQQRAPGRVADEGIGLGVQWGIVGRSISEIYSTDPVRTSQMLALPQPRLRIIHTLGRADDGPWFTFMPEFDPDYVEHHDHPSLPYRLGFSHGYFHDEWEGWVTACRVIAAPAWFVALVLALWPAWCLVTLPARRRAARIAAGLCAACAYDLRAHRPGQKCPECGRVIEAGRPAISAASSS